MKKSFFKRALASFAVIPLALTQCLSYSFAATDESSVASAADSTDLSSAVNTNITLDSLLYINPDAEIVNGVQTSEWNMNVYSMIINAGQNGNGAVAIDPTSAIYLMSANAGAYKELIEVLAGEITETTCEVKSDGRIVLNAKFNDLSKSIAETVQNRVSKEVDAVAEKYPEADLTELKNIDFSALGEIAGTITATVDASALQDSTTTPVTYEINFSDVDHTNLTMTDALYYVLDKYDVAKEAVMNTFENVFAEAQISGVDIDAATEMGKKINDIFFGYENHIVKALNIIATYTDPEFSASRSYADTTEALAGLKAWATKKNMPNVANRIPGTVTAGITKSAANDAFENFKNHLNASVIAPAVLNMTTAEIGAFADNDMKDLEISVEAGILTIKALNVTDKEQAELAAALEEKGLELVSSHKEITFTTNLNSKNTGSGEFTLDIIRVLETKDITTETTTTSVTTGSETETTTVATGSDVTSTTTEATGSDVTSTTTVATGSDVTSTTTKATGSDTDTTTSTTEVSDTDTTTSTTEGSDTDTTTTTTDVSGTDTTTTTDGSETTTTTTTTSYVRAYVVAEVGTQVNAELTGYFFSHDNREFSAGMLETLNVAGDFYLVEEYFDGTNTSTVQVSLADALAAETISFNGATPAGTYDANSGFKYDIPMYYKGEKLTADDGSAINLTAYIGVKGDVNLDGKVTPSDASTTLKYYAAVQTYNGTGNAKDETILCPGAEYASAEYQNLAALLADINVDEKNAENWSLTKSERALTPVDASSVLKFYSSMQTTVDPVVYDVWNSVVPGLLIEQ